MRVLTKEARERKYKRDILYRKMNREKIKAKQVWYYRKHMYGLTKDGYLKLLKKQKYRCAVCKFPNKRLEVDHEHPSNGARRSTWIPTRDKVRGLVCHRCNFALIVLDDKKRFNELQSYRLRYLRKKQKHAAN